MDTMISMAPQPDALPAVQTAPGGRSPLEGITLPVDSADVALSSGRRYSMEARPEGDSLTVRANGGQVVLQVLFTDAGPVLSFQSAELQLRGTRALRLDAESVEVSASHLRTCISGDVEERILGGRHTHIEGADHLEAAAIQAQANRAAFEIRAAGPIALDGEHIGLNDDPCPAPFPWSALADDEEVR